MTVLTIPPSATLTPAAVLTALGAYTAPGTTFTDVAFATALGTTHGREADDVLTSLSTNASPLPKSNQPVVQPVRDGRHVEPHPGRQHRLRLHRHGAGPADHDRQPRGRARGPGEALAGAGDGVHPDPRSLTRAGDDRAGSGPPGDLLTSLSTASSPLPHKVQVQSPAPGNWSVLPGVGLGFRGLPFSPSRRPRPSPRRRRRPRRRSRPPSREPRSCLGAAPGRTSRPAGCSTRSLGTAFELPRRTRSSPSPPSPGSR